jgi:hypothetical protein
MSRTTKIVLVAVPVIILLLAIAIPNFITPHASLSTNACANNLRWIQEAKIKWAHDLNKANTAMPTEEELRPVLRALWMTKDLGAAEFFPKCPSGGTYTIGAVGERVTCSVRELGHALPADYKR